MRTIVAAVTAALLAAGCAAAAAPTAQIVTVTVTATVTQPAPTPIVVYVTAPPRSAPTTHTITGTFELRGGDRTSTLTLTQNGYTDCHGLGGYSDVQSGQPIVVKDGNGSVIATGATAYDTRSAPACAFAFDIPAVPDVPFYSIEIGRRGRQTFSRDHLDAANWHVDLTLGP